MIVIFMSYGRVSTNSGYGKIGRRCIKAEQSHPIDKSYPLH